MTAPEAAHLADSFEQPRVVRRYLVARGLFRQSDAIEVAFFSGGVSSIVGRASSATRCVVFKKARPRLRVPEEWLADTYRTVVEARCAMALNELVPGSAPEVVDVDEPGRVFIMTCAPDGSRPWKEDLLRGRVDFLVARNVGHLLGGIHSRSAGHRVIRAAFQDARFLESLRIRPYLGPLMVKYPELRPQLTSVVKSLRTDRRCLVHGDFSPKNLLIVDSASVLLVDHEVAHWGNPAFDTAFVLTHLSLKGLVVDGAAEVLSECRAVFWRAYEEGVPPPLIDEVTITRTMGALLLARIDGKSPVEYITDDHVRAVARGIGRRLLAGAATSVAAASELVLMARHGR